MAFPQAHAAPLRPHLARGCRVVGCRLAPCGTAARRTPGGCGGSRESPCAHAPAESGRHKYSYRAAHKPVDAIRAARRPRLQRARPGRRTSSHETGRARHERGRPCPRRHLSRPVPSKPLDVKEGGCLIGGSAGDRRMFGRSAGVRLIGPPPDRRKRARDVLLYIG